MQTADDVIGDVETWQSVVLSDSQLWTHVKLAAHVTDNEMVHLIRKVANHVEVLDCSKCTQLTQDSFLTFSRPPVVVLNRLRSLVVPAELTLPDAVYESLANAGCLPQVEQIENIQSGSSVCNPLRCQTYFKKSKLAVLNDCPMASHGRVRRLLVPDSVEVKQRRQRWDADLAKAAISCPTIDTYRCCRGVGYVDDRAIERISVLFPKLRSLHLQLCSVSDEGLAKFFTHNKRSSTPVGDSSSGAAYLGLTRLVLDRPGEITDKGLKIVADNCTYLTHLTLCRCPSVTPSAFRYLLSQCKYLTELHLSKVTCLDDVSITTLVDNCRQLTSLQLFDASSLTSPCVVDLLFHCDLLQTLTLFECHCIDDKCTDAIAQHCHRLNKLSLGIGSSVQITPRAVVNLVMRCTSLTCFHFEANDRFQVTDLRLFAEQTYVLLSNDVTCRSSHIKDLVLTNVSEKFVQVLTVLCAELQSLDLRNVQVGDDWSEALSQVVTACTRLKTLDVTDVETGVTDQFVVDLCEHSLELRHLSLTVGPYVTRDVIDALIHTAPSLASLAVSVTRRSKSSSVSADDGELDENYLTKVVRQYHGDPCYCDVYLQPANSRVKQFELTFTPLKFLTAGKLMAEM